MKWKDDSGDQWSLGKSNIWLKVPARLPSVMLMVLKAFFPIQYWWNPNRYIDFTQTDYRITLIDMSGQWVVSTVIKTAFTIRILTSGHCLPDIILFWLKVRKYIDNDPSNWKYRCNSKEKFNDLKNSKEYEGDMIVAVLFVPSGVVCFFHYNDSIESLTKGKYMMLLEVTYSRGCDKILNNSCALRVVTMSSALLTFPLTNYDEVMPVEDERLFEGLNMSQVLADA